MTSSFSLNSLLEASPPRSFCINSILLIGYKKWAYSFSVNGNFNRNFNETLMKLNRNFNALEQKYTFIWFILGAHTFIVTIGLVKLPIPCLSLQITGDKCYSAAFISLVAIKPTNTLKAPGLPGFPSNSLWPSDVLCHQRSWSILADVIYGLMSDSTKP